MSQVGRHFIVGTESGVMIKQQTSRMVLVVEDVGIDLSVSPRVGFTDVSKSVWAIRSSIDIGGKADG